MRKSVFTVPSRDSRSVSTASVENGTTEASCSQRAREVRHRVVARNAARGPLPHLPDAIAGLTGERLCDQVEVHPVTVATAGLRIPGVDVEVGGVTKPDDSHIDEMREAVRGDFERSRRSHVLSQQLNGDEPGAPEPPSEEETPAPAPRRFLFWRK